MPVNYYYVHYSRPRSTLEEKYFHMSQVVVCTVLHILLITDTMYISIALKFRSSLMTQPPPETTEIPPPVRKSR